MMQKFVGLSLIFMFALSAVLSWAVDGSRSQDHQGSQSSNGTISVRVIRDGASQWMSFPPAQEEHFQLIADRMTFALAEPESRRQGSVEEFRRKGAAIEILYPTTRLLRLGDSISERYDRCFIPINESGSADGLIIFYGNVAGYAATPVRLKGTEPILDSLKSDCGLRR